MIPGSAIHAGTLQIEPIGSLAADFIVLGFYNPMFIEAEMGAVTDQDIPYWTLTDTASNTFALVTDDTYPSGRRLELTSTGAGTALLVGAPVPVQPYAYLTPVMVLGHIPGGAGRAVTVRMDIYLSRDDEALVRSFVAITQTYLTADGTLGPVQYVGTPFQVAANERTALASVEVIVGSGGAGGFPTVEFGMVALYDAVGTEQIADASIATGDLADSAVTAAKIANRTRGFELKPKDAGLDGATLAVITGAVSPNFSSVIVYANAATQGAYWNFMVPLDWASGVITIQPVWSPSATDLTTPAAVRWSMSCRLLPAGNTIINAGTVTTWTGADAARTVNVIVYDTATSTTLTPAAAGDYFRFELQRIGADAADTYVGNVELVGVRVTYTADS